MLLLAHRRRLLILAGALQILLFTTTFSVIVDAAENPAEAPERPQFDLQARVKQHRRGAEGSLVPGEENLRKIILSWDRVENAEAYEVCHDCHDIINDDTGIISSKTTTPLLVDKDGIVKVFPLAVGRAFECGMRPCLVLPGAPIGYNRFHIRVKVGSEWSAWSKHRNFLVAEPGAVEHQEL
jgi:hypothetical protein